MTPPDREPMRAVHDALNRLHDDIADVRDRVTELSDRVNAYHGDTRGAADCKECRDSIDTQLSSKVGRREFLLVSGTIITVLGIVGTVVSVVRGLL